MDREPVPSAIVARLLEAAKELEEWAVEHRQATLAEHERGVLHIVRSVMGSTLGAVLEHARQLDHPAAQWQRAACPECGKRRRPPATPVARAAAGEGVRRNAVSTPVLLVSGVSPG